MALRQMIFGGALAAAAFMAVTPANAQDFRVIRWSITGICQIYDFGWGFPPIPGDYRMLTRPLPSFAAALHAKDRLWRHGRCSI